MDSQNINGTDSSEKKDTGQVETNMGTMSMEDYLDIKAVQYGFEDYADMKKQGLYLEEESQAEPVSELEPEPEQMQSEIVKKSNTELLNEEIDHFTEHLEQTSSNADYGIDTSGFLKDMQNGDFSSTSAFLDELEKYYSGLIENFHDLPSDVQSALQKPDAFRKDFELLKSDLQILQGASDSIRLLDDKGISLEDVFNIHKMVSLVMEVFWENKDWDWEIPGAVEKYSFDMISQCLENAGDTDLEDMLIDINNFKKSLNIGGVDALSVLDIVRGIKNNYFPVMTLEQNPIAHVEELEEGNYNMIDGIPNNGFGEKEKDFAEEMADFLESEESRAREQEEKLIHESDQRKVENGKVIDTFHDVAFTNSLRSFADLDFVLKEFPFEDEPGKFSYELSVNGNFIADWDYKPNFSQMTEAYLDYEALGIGSIVESYAMDGRFISEDAAFESFYGSQIKNMADVKADIEKAFSGFNRTSTDSIPINEVMDKWGAEPVQQILAFNVLFNSEDARIPEQVFQWADHKMSIDQMENKDKGLLLSVNAGLLGAVTQDAMKYEQNTTKEKEGMIFKLTGTPVSQEMIDVIERLQNGNYVSRSEIDKTEEVELAYSILHSEGKNTNIDMASRKPLLDAIYKKMEQIASAVIDENGKTVYNGDVSRNARLDIIIGLPASGKSSTLVDPISSEFHSRLIDCDEAKKEFPEFNNGWGADVVHKESQMVCDKLFRNCLVKKENIVLPKVGSDSTKLLNNYIQKAKLEGYKVYVHYADLDRNKALGRMLKRFCETGRFLAPALADKYAPVLNGKTQNHILDAYEALKSSGMVDGFTKWNNDVAYGEKPILLENIGCIGNFIDNARKEEREGQEHGGHKNMGERESGTGNRGNEQSGNDLHNKVLGQSTQSIRGDEQQIDRQIIRELPVAGNTGNDNRGSAESPGQVKIDIHITFEGLQTRKTELDAERKPMENDGPGGRGGGGRDDR